MLEAVSVDVMRADVMRGDVMSSATAYVAVLVLPGPRVISSAMCGTREYAEAYLAWLRRLEEGAGGRVLSASVQEKRVVPRLRGRA